MILSDTTIRQQLRDKHLVIDPAPADVQIQPASVDLTLGRGFLCPYGGPEVDQDRYLLGPGDCILATTMEYIEIPDYLVARVEGKSSWGRKFLMVHATAGFIDPGFAGQVTLELTNLSKVSHLLLVGAAIAQISFQMVDQPVARGYGTAALNNHYQDQVGVTPSALPWD